jgi:hypothetical protein
MALLKYEHFDLYGTDTDDLLANGYTFEGGPLDLVTPARTGPYCLATNGGSGDPQFLEYTIPGSARSTLGVGVAMIVPSDLTDDPDGPGVYVDYSGGSIRILPGADNKINIYEGAFPFAPIASSSSESFAPNSWIYIEVKLVAGTGTASVAVRLNGNDIVSALDYTFGDLTQVRLGSGAGFAAGSIFFDDLVVWDTAGPANNDWMGDCEVVIAAPNADGPAVGFTPAMSGEPLFEMVNNLTPMDVVEYITAAGAGDSEELDHNDPDLSANSVAAVAAQVRAFKTEAAAASIEVGVDSNGTDSVSAAITLDAVAAYHSYILDLDPSGSVSWTNARALAAKTRVESDTTSPATSRVSQQFKVLVVRQGAAPAPGSGITFENVTVSGFSITL